MGIGKDRRRQGRTPLQRPVKVQCLITGKYLAGRTSNLSDAGLLLELDNPSLLVPGQRVKVGIQQTRQDAVLKAKLMAGATVVRSMGIGGKQTVAIQFDQRQRLSKTA
jgi:hypothetical protein